MKFELVTFLIAIFTMVILTLTVNLQNAFCISEFGGVWSSIVIKDCSGSFWTPTGSGISAADALWHTGYLQGGLAQ